MHPTPVLTHDTSLANSYHLEPSLGMCGIGTIRTSKKWSLLYEPHGGYSRDKGPALGSLKGGQGPQGTWLHLSFLPPAHFLPGACSYPIPISQPKGDAIFVVVSPTHKVRNSLPLLGARCRPSGSLAFLAVLSSCPKN